MKKRIRIWQLVGFAVTSLFGTLLHFLYEWTNEAIWIAPFSGVNESTWEHMKLLFFPMYLYSLFASKNLKKTYPCISSSMAFGTLLGTFLIPVLFYTYSGILGFNIPIIDISTFYISVIISFFVVYKTTISCSLNTYKVLFDILLFIMAVLFIIFSVFPPDIALFKAP